VKTRYLPETQAAEITVADNGTGIDPEYMDMIFQPFASTKGQRGTGLGLAVTKKIIDEHGGSISVTSQPKQGTTFVITLSAETAGEVNSGDTRLPRPQTNLEEF